MTPDFLAGFLSGAACTAIVLVPAAIRAIRGERARWCMVRSEDVATAWRRGRR